MAPAKGSSNAKVLLLGKIDHAHEEWASVSELAETTQVTTGNRAEFISDCKNGVYNSIVAISRTYASVEITGHFDAELINALPASVKSISHNGAGYDQIDIAPCTARGIAVSNTPTAVDNATANVAMMLLLGALRRSWGPVSAIRRGEWRGKNMTLGHDPEGKTLGVLGMGGIGGALAKRAKAFDMEVIYHNRTKLSQEKNPTGARWVELDELLASSDVISVHLPLSEATRGFLGTEQFAKVKDGVILINTARGPIIDEQALLKALDSGKVWAAGLDVFDKEPEVNPELIKNDKVVIFPHIGTATIETQKKMEVLVIDNVKSLLKEGRLLTQVPEQKGKSVL